MSYGDYLRIRIFEPLEMRSSFTELSSAQSAGLVQGHRFIVLAIAAIHDEFTNVAGD
jgi:CubicO group peptidase (beta-lactamase class C family)